MFTAAAACLNNMKSCMILNFLQLNENKTKVIIFGESGFLDMGTHGPFACNIHSSVKNLDVYFDNAFKFDKQISPVMRSNFFQLL